MADMNPHTETGGTPAGGQPVAHQEITLNDQGAHAAYANFARVTATPEEVIVDFALNANPFLQGKQEVQVTQRLVLSLYTAKRLSSALLMTLQRHEATFGTIELDVRRRAHLPPPGGTADAVFRKLEDLQR
jgi:Protein of unknown function (DUF3467)